MSVLVKGMRMPQSCYYCGLADTSFINCVAFEKPIVLEDDCEERRPDWCTLVEHGECQKCYKREERGCAIFCREWNRYTVHKGYCYRYTEGRNENIVRSASTKNGQSDMVIRLSELN